jgi:hypothetical protein
MNNMKEGTGILAGPVIHQPANHTPPWLCSCLLASLLLTLWQMQIGEVGQDSLMCMLAPRAPRLPCNAVGAAVYRLAVWWWWCGGVVAPPPELGLGGVGGLG